MPSPRTVRLVASRAAFKDCKAGDLFFRNDGGESGYILEGPPADAVAAKLDDAIFLLQDASVMIADQIAESPTAASDALALVGIRAQIVREDY